MHNQLVRNAAVVLTLLSGPLVAQTSPHTPAEVVQAFHAALAAGDSSGALSGSRLRVLRATRSKLPEASIPIPHPILRH